MGFISWIIFGLIVGVIAKLLTPGRDPGGFIVTVLIGVVGSLLGGGISTMLGFNSGGQGAGWIMSILGAVLLLWIYRTVTTRSTAT